MKKILFFIISIMLAMTTVFLNACGRIPQNTQSELQTETKDEIVLNSFENYYDAYNFYNFGDPFKLDFNEDKKYVTHGYNSMKFSSGIIDAQKVSSSMFGVALYDNSKDYNYRDFSKLSKITYNVFNSSNSEIKIHTSILQKKVGYLYSNSTTTVLPVNQWTTITYNVNRYEIFYSLGIDGPTHICVNVEGVNPVVYFDEMKLHFTPNVFVNPDVNIDENEILSYEKAYQSFVSYTTGTILKSEVVIDPENASEGQRYMRVYRNGIPDGQLVYEGKYGISAKYLSNINFESHNNDYIAFDYKTSWTGQDMWVVPRLVSTQSGAYKNIAHVGLPCNEKWHTVYIPVSLAPQFFDTIELSFDGGTYGDFFLDNFRIESTAKENGVVIPKE